MTLATVLTWALLGQLGGGFAGPSPLNNPSFMTASPPGASTFAGSTLDLTTAERRAPTIRVGRPTSISGLMLQGSAMMGVCDLKFSETLKGPVVETTAARFGITAVNGETLPRVGDDHLFFIARRRDADVVTKVLAATPANLAAVRQVIAAAEVRALPNSRLPTDEAWARAHTIVVAGVTGGAVLGAGAVGLGWCDLQVASGLKGEARAVDGRRIGYIARSGGKPPTVGRPYLLFIGTDHDRDAILKVEPATPGNIRWIERLEADLKAIQAGAARCIPGANITIAAAAAEAKAHTIFVGEVQNHVEFGAGGFGGACSMFRVTSTLKGQARPGDRLGASYQPTDGGIRPQLGESFLVFLGIVGEAGDRDVDGAIKMLPATPANVQAARDQVGAGAPPVAAR